MFCALCGADNPNDGRFCGKCGSVLQGQKGMPEPGTAFDGLAQPYTGPTETSGMAIVSLICGILFLVFPIAIVAIVLGHLSLSEIRRAGGRLTGHGLAVAGLVLGYAGVAVIPIALIVAAIAIPNLLRSKNTRRTKHRLSDPSAQLIRRRSRIPRSIQMAFPPALLRWMELRGAIPAAIMRS